MAKKRGGIAGLYDRNKGLVRTAGILAGTGLGALVGGPAGAKAGGALAGAAFRGFDRPGQRGIGFDIGQGALGAAEGYGTAALASGLMGRGAATGGTGEKVKSGVQRLLTGARENKDLIAMAGKGIMSAMPQPGEEAAMMNAETARMRLEEEQRQVQREEERRRRIAELLMPYARQAFGSVYPGMTP